LKRAGLVAGRRLRRRVAGRPGGLRMPKHANHLWAADHKGWVRLGDGTRCEPLTITDGFSRYLVQLVQLGARQEHAGGGGQAFVRTGLFRVWPVGGDPHG
jgi:putative transposase